MIDLKKVISGLMAGSILLSGCGGGGGGGATGSSGQGTGPGDVEAPAQAVLPTFVADRGQLHFININGALPAYDSVTFTVVGDLGSYTFYPFFESDANADIGTVYLDGVSDTSLKMTVVPDPQTRDASGTMLFKMCTEDPCSKVVWSRSLPYQYRNYTIDTSEFKLTGVEGGASIVTRPIRPAAKASSLQITTATGDGGTWLSARIDDAGELELKIDGASMRRGNYAGEVLIGTMQSDLGTVRIPVSLTLGEGFALPASAKVTLDARSPATIEGKIDLAFNGALSPAWMAGSDKPWLVLRKSSGTGADTVGYTIDTAKLAGLPNFESETANVYFSATYLPSTAYKIVVQKQLPEIYGLTPNPIRAGQAADIRVRGRGLRQLSGIGAIRIDNVPVTRGTILSDTEALVSVPALAAGTHTVGVPFAAGAGLAQAVLNVAGAAATAPALIDSAAAKKVLLYNAGRSSLYTVDATKGTLLRYRLSGTGWTMSTSAPVSRSARIGLSSDGAALYTASDCNTLEERDPDTLALRASYIDGNCLDSDGGTGSGKLHMTNDGKIWFRDETTERLRYFDTHTRRFSNADQPVVANKRFVLAHFTVSADGGTMIVGEPGQGIEGNKGTLRYDAATGTFGYMTGIPDFGWHAYLSGDGSKLFSASTSTLYDTATGKPLGKVPVANGDPPLPVLLSPDGSRVYLVNGSVDGKRLVWSRLDVVDTAAMMKIGEVPVPAGVNACGQESWECVDERLIISPFGDTIFWSGNQKIAVIPLPGTLRASAAGARLRLVR